MMNKIYKILLIIIAISSGTFLSSMKHPATATLNAERNLLDLPNEMLVQIAHNLDNRSLGHLNQASWRTQAITQAILQQRHEQWLFNNRRMVDCCGLKNNHPDVDGFINAVLEKLTSAYTAHPDRWFELNLSWNNLGNLSDADLKRVFDTIGQRAESLKINIVLLDLSSNQLQTLPNNIFDNRGNLQALRLDNNQLQTLPNNIFDNLGKLQWLWFYNNQLQTLPNNIFNNLGNLQWLWLKNNHLQTLPNNIFDKLENLQTLWLDNNQFDHETQSALQVFQVTRPGINIHF